MAPTKAQKRTPKATYGKQTHRGNIGESHAAKILREQGYSVSLFPQHPHGKADLIARKGNITRFIQVKRISSRVFLTEKSCRNRMAGAPYNIQRIPQGVELWVFDAQNHLYVFK